MTVECHRCKSTVSRYYRLIDTVYYCAECAEEKQVNHLIIESTMLTKKGIARLYDAIGQVYAETIHAEVKK